MGRLYMDERAMEGNLLYLFLNAIGQMINSTWSVSATALAYLKYGK